jgi:hypothetical protein
VALDGLGEGTSGGVCRACQMVGHTFRGLLSGPAHGEAGSSVLYFNFYYRTLLLHEHLKDALPKERP